MQTGHSQIGLKGFNLNKRSLEHHWGGKSRSARGTQILHDSSQKEEGIVSLRENKMLPNHEAQTNQFSSNIT